MCLKKAKAQFPYLVHDGQAWSTTITPTRHKAYLPDGVAKRSCLRPGSGLALGFGVFLTSFLPLSLFPMSASVTQPGDNHAKKVDGAPVPSTHLDLVWISQQRECGASCAPRSDGARMNFVTSPPGFAVLHLGLGCFQIRSLRCMIRVTLSSGEKCGVVLALEASTLMERQQNQRSST